MGNRDAVAALSLVCVLCAAGIGFAARDIALDMTQSADSARLIGIAAGALVVGGFAVLITLGRRR